MSDERKEQAWKAWWGDRGFNPAHHLAFNEGWDAGCDEMEALTAALRKARETMLDALVHLRYHPIRDWKACDVRRRLLEGVAEIDAVLEAKT